MSFFSVRYPLALTIALMFAGCGQLPKPFKSELGGGAESPLIALLDSVGVVVVPIDGAPLGVAGPLADIMAAELRLANVAATTGSAVKSAILLEGRAAIELAAEGQGIVAVAWTVTDGTGAVIKAIQSQQMVSVDAWYSAARIPMNAVASDAVPRIVTVLRTKFANVALLERPTIAVVAIEGAPGDGNEALKRAFTAVLVNAGLPVAPEPPNAAIQIFGNVDISDFEDGREKLEIQWTLRKLDGSEIGTMTQANAVEKGRVTAQWGSLAYDMTFAMIDSIADILQTIERTDDIRLSR